MVKALEGRERGRGWLYVIHLSNTDVVQNSTCRRDFHRSLTGRISQRLLKNGPAPLEDTKGALNDLHAHTTTATQTGSCGVRLNGWRHESHTHTHTHTTTGHETLLPPSISLPLPPHPLMTHHACTRLPVVPELLPVVKPACCLSLKRDHHSRS